jgi:hypothetical protein
MMRFFKPLILLITLLFISVVAINCSGGIITPVNPDDNNGDDNGNGDQNPLPPWNNSPSAWVGVLPTQRTYVQGDPVEFDGSQSVDPDNDIIKYEWDFHYDDASFDVELSGPILSYDLPSFGSVIAALRVSDDGDPVRSDIMRTRLLVEPKGEISNITNGNVDNFLLRKAVTSNGDFYVLYSGTYDSEANAYVQRSSDGGETWGDPVKISTDIADRIQWGVWMDASPFGIVVGWMTNTGKIRYAAGTPDGVNSIAFSSPTQVGSTSLGYPKPVFYTIACAGDGSYVYFLYLTVDAYSLRLIRADLNGTAIGTPEEIIIRDDNADRYKFTGTHVAAGPSGRAYVVYSWKSLGYDNADEILLQYVDPSSTDVMGPIRVDVGLDGFIFNHDPYVIVNKNNEPIVIFRTTGIYQGGKDVALCVGDGDPPVFRTAIRANNTLNGETLAPQNSPSIAIDQDYGHVWVAFEDFRQANKISQAYLTMFDDQYSTLLPDFDISDDPALIYSDINPQVCISSGLEKTLLVVWERNGTDIVAYHAKHN